MHGLEGSIIRMLDREYPIVFGARKEMIRDSDGMHTWDFKSWKESNLTNLDELITTTMFSQYNHQISEVLVDSSPVFLIDGNKKTQTHVIYEILKQIIFKYHDHLKRNKNILEELSYMHDGLHLGDTPQESWLNFQNMIDNEELNYQNCNLERLQNMKDIGLGSTPVELSAYYLSKSVLSLIGSCIEHIHAKNSKNIDNNIYHGYLYCINPQGLSKHEQQSINKMLERGYLGGFGHGNLRCHLKINNTFKGWISYHTDGGSPIQDPHDYSTLLINEKEINEYRKNIIEK